MAFYNGGISNKYLILLNSPKRSEPYLFVKTTSQQKDKSKKTGCLENDSLFFIPTGTTFFQKDTWIQLHEIYPIQPDHIHNNSKIEFIRELDPKIIDDIVKCLFLTQNNDIPKIYRHLLWPPIEEYKMKLAEKFKIKK